MERFFLAHSSINTRYVSCVKDLWEQMPGKQVLSILGIYVTRELAHSTGPRIPRTYQVDM
jgi:hypothetical protein